MKDIKSARAPLSIWCNARFPESERQMLEHGVGQHRLILAGSLEESNLVGSKTDSSARSADIALGQPHPDDVMASMSLRWIHLTSAGYTRYDRDDIRAALTARGAAMTNSSHVYADPCAQHVLSFMLAGARRLFQAQSDQLAQRSWPYLALRGRCEILTGQRALIVGFGSIGARLVELLAPFSMHLTAVRRNPRGHEKVQTHSIDKIDECLPDADHVINLLPAGTQSKGFFNAERFKKMKRSAVFYNVGRGDTVDQDALIAALQRQTIAAACLDVTTPEPLPPEHPLWKAPNCYITPHLAGGQQNEMRRLVEHFLANLARFDDGRPLVDRII
jgi:phosphoglycerate dehydrogenase-like enzyme